MIALADHSRLGTSCQGRSRRQGHAGLTQSKLGARKIGERICDHFRMVESSGRQCDSRRARSLMLDDFIDEFDRERPHQALQMKCPAEIYSASSTTLPGLSRDLSTPSTTGPQWSSFRPALPLPIRSNLSRFWRPGCGSQRSGKPKLARQLHGLRSWLRGSGGENTAAPRKPLRAQSVIHV